MTWLFIIIGGWNGLLIFRENNRDSDFAGLKRTSHFCAHWWIFFMSELCRLSSVVNSYKKTFIVSKKTYVTVNIFNNIIDLYKKLERPWGTPSLIGFQLELVPGRTTLCLRLFK